MKKIALIILLLFCTSKIYTQTKAEKNLGSWIVYYGNHTISNNWSILTGFEERNYKTTENYNLTLYKIGVSYKISKKFKATFSYLYLDIDRTFEPDIDPNTIENRFYEQISYSAKHFKIPFKHRVRLEQRNLKNLGVNTLINRVRYRLKTTISLSKKLYLTASNESFLNFKGTVYAENRFYSAIGLKASKMVSLEVGYLGQYINNLHLDRLQVGVFLNTGFRKKR